MKKIFFILTPLAFLIQPALAQLAPAVLTGPFSDGTATNPTTINTSVDPGDSQTVYYLFQSNIPKSINTAISGLTADFISHSGCSSVPARSSCIEAVTIAPTSADSGHTTSSQQLTIDYGGRAPVAAPAFTVSVSSNLATLSFVTAPAPLLLKSSGNARSFIVRNDSAAYDATNVTTNLTSLPIVASVSPSGGCGTIASGGTCTITITPAAGAAAGAAAATGRFTVSGTNTNTLTGSLAVLNYGNTYQDGYIFSLDDTTTPLSAKAAALTDNAASAGGVNWSASASNLLTSATDGSGNVTVFENSVPGLTSTSFPPEYNCTQEVSTHGYTGWFLPAFCEMSGSSTSPCSESTAANSMQTNLYSLGIFSINAYWSSSQSSFSNAYTQAFNGSGGTQGASSKTASTAIVRCARVIT